MSRILDLFRKKKPVQQSRIRSEVMYFVNGGDVVFKLRELDFTFEKFYASISQGSLILQIEDEAPMNLINILSVVDDQIGVIRSRVLDADTSNFTLVLKEEIYSTISNRILESPDIKDAFDLKVGGKKPLRSLSSYELHGFSLREVF